MFVVKQRNKIHFQRTCERTLGQCGVLSACQSLIFLQRIILLNMRNLCLDSPNVTASQMCFTESVDEMLQSRCDVYK